MTWILDTGAYEEEPDVARGARRLFVGALWLSLLVIGVFSALKFVAGAPIAGVIGLVQLFIHLGVLLALRAFPLRLFPLTNIVFVYAVFSELATTYLYGGLLSAGVTVIWVMITVLINLILFGVRFAVGWFGVFIAAVVVSAWMQGNVDARYTLTSPAFDGAMNIIVAMSVTMAVLAYFVVQRDRFQAESDQLLHNILPIPIAKRLKAGEQPIADDVPGVSVLFADIVGFTPMSAGMGAPDLIDLLNEVFTTFDDLVADAGLEKIKTVGDEYMVAAGVPQPRIDHATVIAELALAMRDAVGAKAFAGRKLEIRIGISSGRVVAGVIGKGKFSYDLWGATVNTASRMQSSGVPGRIQISESTCELVRDRFRCEPRGSIAVKGLDDMDTWFLEELEGTG